MSTYERCRAALAELGLLGSPALEEVHSAAVFEAPRARSPAEATVTVPLVALARREERRTVSAFFAEVGGAAGPALKTQRTSSRSSARRWRG